MSGLIKHPQDYARLTDEVLSTYDKARYTWTLGAGAVAASLAVNSEAGPALASSLIIGVIGSFVLMGKVSRRDLLVDAIRNDNLVDYKYYYKTKGFDDMVEVGSEAIEESYGMLHSSRFYGNVLSASLPVATPLLATSLAEISWSSPEMIVPCIASGVVVAVSEVATLTSAGEAQSKAQGLSSLWSQL